jgi:hypothetical protein
VVVDVLALLGREEMAEVMVVQTALADKRHKVETLQMVHLIPAVVKMMTAL